MEPCETNKPGGIADVNSYVSCGMCAGAQHSSTGIKVPITVGHLTRPDAFAGKCGIIKLTCLLVLALIGWFDYATGYELGFFIFYFIPVAISSWYCGRRLGIQIAFGSALVWYLSDKYTFHPYSNAYFIYWEMFMRLLSFLTTTITVSRIRTMVLNEERMLSELLAVRLELESFKNSAAGKVRQEGKDILKEENL